MVPEDVPGVFDRVERALHAPEKRLWSAGRRLHLVFAACHFIPRM